VTKPRSEFDDLALLTDLYQLTMAYGYWKTGRSEEEAAFHQFFRENPFQGGYAVAAGLADVVDYLDNLRFSNESLEYLATLTGNDEQRLFPDTFLSYLRELEFACDVDAIPEGTVVFAQEPLVRVKGPILQCQIIESAILNFVNFQTLVATKAARICEAAAGDAVIEFGLRRAQGMNGSLAASRAAYIGGCSATSNVLAGRLFSIPVKGTHAHSWVMSFDDEAESFARYAEAMPNNCVFLVDTFDTLNGVRLAIETGHRLRDQGHEMVGIRLDSGDLAYLSIEARRLLDEAGFPNASIVASNDLDEQIIQDLKQQGAKINVWGVGTKLATAYDQPALGGVYKLTAIRQDDGEWRHRIKLSEQAIKVTTPGILQVRRFRQGDALVADMIYDELAGIQESTHIVDPKDATRRRSVDARYEYEDLLLPVFRRGKNVLDPPALTKSRERVKAQLLALHPSVRRLMNPHKYPVGLELALFELKSKLIRDAREGS
jgi:nicotinate phosphoribosyltransferase